MALLPDPRADIFIVASLKEGSDLPQVLVSARYCRIVWASYSRRGIE